MFVNYIYVSLLTIVEIATHMLRHCYKKVPISCVMFEHPLPGPLPLPRRAQIKKGIHAIFKTTMVLKWSIHGNLNVTLMLDFCPRSSSKRRQYYNITLTTLRQHLVDENPKLFKTHPGAAKRPPGCSVLSLGSHQSSFIKVLSC